MTILVCWPDLTSPTEDVWSALSDFFLDTETRRFLPRTAWICARSGLDWERLLREQVAPVVAQNLVDVAGDWAGFPDDWLFSSIRAHGSKGETPLSRRLVREMSGLWEALRQLVVYLSTASQSELPLLEALAELALERDWARALRLFAYLRVMVVWPWPGLCLRQQLIQEVYRPLLVYPQDPTVADARRSWDWLEQFYLWADGDAEKVAQCEDLRYLFGEGDLGQHARVQKLRKQPGDRRSFLEGPLALLFPQPELGLRNWDRYVETLRRP